MSNELHLRILHILPSLGVGGAENMAAHLMVGLAADHDVTAVGLYPPADTPVEGRLRDANVRVRHLGKRQGMDLRMLSSLDRAICEIQPQVVHTHLYVLRYVFPVLCRRRVPLAVHTLHNTAEREADSFGRLMQRLAFWRSVVPVAISQQGAASFLRLYGHECAAVIPNSIPISHYEKPPDAGRQWRQRNGFATDAILFTCVGRLEQQKNPLGLVEAFAAIDDERAHLVLLGDGSLRTRVVDSIRKARLEGRVHVLGKRNDIPDCLAASDVFVLASHWEGNPLSVMEAMAAGLPVLSTAVGGVPEVVRDERDGILIAAGDIRGLSLAMRRLANEEERRREFGIAAREHARAEFDAESMTRKYATLYRSLLSRGQRTERAYSQAQGSKSS